MKYRDEIVLDIPLDEFWKKIDDPENMKHWQRGLLEYRYLSDKKGKTGSKMELLFQIGKRKITLIETILEKKRPNVFYATYDSKGIRNTQRNTFQAIDGNKTRWSVETEIQFKGLKMNAIGVFAPSMFKKQSRLYLTDFKAFAEDGVSVLDNNLSPLNRVI